MQKTKVCVAVTFKYFASYVYDLKMKLTTSISLRPVVQRC